MAVAGAETRRSTLSVFFTETGNVVCTFARTAGLGLCAVMGLCPFVGHGGTGKLEMGLYFLAGRGGWGSAFSSSTGAGRLLGVVLFVEGLCSGIIVEAIPFVSVGAAVFGALPDELNGAAIGSLCVDRADALMCLRAVAGGGSTLDAGVELETGGLGALTGASVRCEP